jgi:hypothetical protein
MTYGTGSVSGTLAKDVARFADFELPLTFGLAKNVSQEFKSYPMDGILGLGRPGETSVGTSPILEEMVSNKLIPAKLFAVHLSRTSDGLNDGELNFGAPNPERFEGDLLYLNAVANSGFWEIPVDDAGVDDTWLKVNGRTAIIDTGTSFILMPPADAQKLHKLIPESTQNGEQFNVPCASSAKVQITFSSVTYEISPRDYVGKSVSGDGKACSSNIIGRQAFGDKQWLVGDVFLKNVYAVFDLDRNRVGFGRKSDTATQLTETSSTAPASSEKSSPSASTESSTLQYQHFSDPIVSTTTVKTFPCVFPQSFSLASASSISQPVATPFSVISSPSHTVYLLSGSDSVAEAFCTAFPSIHSIQTLHAPTAAMGKSSNITIGPVPGSRSANGDSEQESQSSPTRTGTETPRENGARGHQTIASSLLLVLVLATGLASAIL